MMKINLPESAIQSLIYMLDDRISKFSGFDNMKQAAFELKKVRASLDTQLKLRKREKKSKNPRHPIQPIVTDAQGVVRFKSNKVVEFFFNLDKTGDMSLLATLKFPKNDVEQFLQLTGTSASSYCHNHPMVSKASADEAYQDYMEHQETESK